MKTKDKENNNILSITQIKIKLSDKKEITLSSNEARKVYEELGKLFKLEDKEKLESDIERLKKLFPEKEYIPYPYPVAPIYIEKEPSWPTNPPWIVTCESKPITVSEFGTIGNPFKFNDQSTCLLINLTNNS